MRRYHKIKAEKFLIGTICVSALLMLGIGYAILTQQLEINGTAQITSNWKILFTSAEEKEMMNATTTRKEISNQTTLNLNVELQQPGASATYDVVVENQGTLDAVLSNIEGIEESNQKDPKSIKVSIDNIEIGDPLLVNDKKTFQVKVYWDENVDFSETNMNKEIQITLTYEQSDEIVIPTPEPITGNAVEVLTSKNTPDNEEGLFTDDFGNIRYRGSNDEVNNYVQFNNELWRIIGVFDGKLKLIRNSSYMSAPWSNNGSNNWNNSSLKSSLANYYNYMNSVSKGQVAESIFYLGGVMGTTIYDITSQTVYNAERGTSVYSSNPTSTTQYVGLMYPSDYGYAASPLCTKTKLYEYGTDSNCGGTGNWLYTGQNEWLQTPVAHIGQSALYVGSVGIRNSSYTLSSNYNIRPVVFLKSSVNIVNGFGTQSSPYILG